MLWNQLNKETREHHIACVELFYRLHCLAPSANICEDIICQALLDRDKVSSGCTGAPPALWNCSQISCCSLLYIFTAMVVFSMSLTGSVPACTIPWGLFSGGLVLHLIPGYKIYQLILAGDFSSSPNPATSENLQLLLVFPTAPVPPISVKPFDFSFDFIVFGLTISCILSEPVINSFPSLI